MAKPENAGIYRAEVHEAGLGESKSGLAYVGLLLGLTEQRDGEEWVDVRPYQWEIGHNAFLEKRDGDANENAIKQLREAFGWDGLDIGWFETATLPECQVVLEWETWTGNDGQERQSLKVKWLNPYDYSGNGGGGGIPHSDDDVRRRIQSRLGSKLRALSGTPPARPAVTPRAPASGPPPRTPAPATPPVSDDDEATVWAEFKQECSERDVPEDVVRTLWNDALTAVAGEALGVLDALDGAQCQDLRIALGEALSKV